MVQVLVPVKINAVKNKEPFLACLEPVADFLHKFLWHPGIRFFEFLAIRC